ncbi:MAG: peptidase M23B [Candidatus Magasanikbacteria bacterium]|nr:peptidase M23B [Candidatus Magasanikbacteria bacterium]
MDMELRIENRERGILRTGNKKTLPIIFFVLCSLFSIPFVLTSRPVAAEEVSSTPVKSESTTSSGVSASSTPESGEPSNESLKELSRKIDEKKAKIKDIEKDIAAYNKNIQVKQTEQLSLANQISIIDNRLEKIKLDVQATEAETDVLKLEIKGLDSQITAAQSRLTASQKKLSALLRQVSMRDRTSYVEILLTRPTFSDFFNDLRSVQDLSVDIGDLTRSVRLVKENLESQRKAKGERTQKLLELKKVLEGQHSKVDEQRETKSRLIADTRNSELKFHKLVSNLRVVYQQTEAEISDIEKTIRKKLESVDKFKNLGEAIFTWPVPSRVINATFHDPDYPYRSFFEHSGIDIRAGQGTAIQAAAPGYIARARDAGMGYSYVMIVHTGGYATVYGHVSRLLVKEDQFVGRGDVIALSGGRPGTSGAGPFATGPHLHFEVRLNGIPLNPLDFLP